MVKQMAGPAAIIKKPGDIFKIKMIRPNLEKKQVILHELYTYYLSYKGI